MEVLRDADDNSWFIGTPKDAMERPTVDDEEEWIFAMGPDEDPEVNPAGGDALASDEVEFVEVQEESGELAPPPLEEEDPREDSDDVFAILD